MTQSYKVGPGLLTLGAVPLDITAQITSCKVTPSEQVESTDAIPTLDGGQVDGEEEASYTFEISGNLFQDLATAGVVDFSWTNMGVYVPFVFVPNSVTDRAVGGLCRMVPIEIGGDVKARAQSDFTWTIKGTPIFGEADFVTDAVDELV